MTQQADLHFSTPAAPATGADAPHTVVVPEQRSAPPGAWAPSAPPTPPFAALPPAGLPPMSPYGGAHGAPYVPAPRSSSGKIIGIVLGAIGGVLVLLVVLVVVVGSLYAGAVDPAPAAPTSAPAVPYSPPAGSSSGAPSSASDYSGTTAVFAPAGKRLDAARTTLDQDLTTASQAKDVDALHDAFSTFRRELATYRAAVAGLPVPADQQAAFATLRESIDATLADCDDVAASSSQSGLSAAAGHFDEHWKTLVTTHNQLIDALPSR